MQDPRKNFDPNSADFDPTAFGWHENEEPKAAAASAADPYSGETFYPPETDEEDSTEQKTASEETDKGVQKPAYSATVRVRRGARRNEGFITMLVLAFLVLIAAIAVPNWIFRLKNVQVIFTGQHEYT